MANKLTAPKDKSIESIIQTVSVLYLLVWSVAPALQIDLIFRLAALGLAFLWFFIEFVRHFEFTQIQIWCALFMLAVAVIAYIRGSFSAVIGEIAVYMMVLAYFINIYSENDWQNYSLIVPIIIGILLFCNIRTGNALSTDTTLARRLVRDDENMQIYMRQMIGGYGLVYPEICIAPVVYAWTLKSFEYNKLYFALGVAWVISFFRVILSAGYSIAVFAAVSSLIILLFYRRRSVVPAFIISFLLIAGIVLGLIYWEGFRNVVLKIFDGTKVVRKIEDLIYSVEGDETAFSISERIRRYKLSATTALTYPIIGGQIFNAPIGTHSEILDLLAKYGLWGAVPEIIMIFHAPVSQKTEDASTTIIATANAHMVAIGLVALLDPFCYNIYFPLLILCPIMYSDIIKWTGEQHYEDTVDS